MANHAQTLAVAARLGIAVNRHGAEILVKAPNLSAQAMVGDRNFRPRVVRDRTKYSRKGRQARDFS